jgi:DNA primase
VLPQGVRSVVIAVDRDDAGEGAAREAASRWRAEGRHVRLLVPDMPGADAADVLRAIGAAHA